MLKKLVLVSLVFLTAFVLGGAFLPSEHHVERSVTLKQSPSVVYTLLNSYRTFNEWSPWASRDPNAVYRTSGPDSGVGARLDWSGDPRQVGTGWQQITSSTPYNRVEMHLDFGEQGIASSFFDISPVEGGSAVTWGFSTDVTADKGVLGALMGKYFGLLLDKWVGLDYEQGLANFKVYAEALPASDFEGAAIEVVNVEPLQILYVSGSTSQEAGDVAEALAAAFAEITVFMADNDLEMSGQPMAITRGWDEAGYRFDAAIPVDEAPGSTTGNVMSGFSPSGPAVRYVHLGSYDGMLEAYDQLAAFMASNGLVEGAVSWEHYISDPGNTPEEEIVTHIYFLLDR